MKTKDEIDAARGKLAKRMLTPGLSGEQKALICGMLNALVWVADGANASTMERLLADEPIDAGKSATPALKALDEGLGRYQCPRCKGPMAHSRLRGLFCPTCR